LSDCGGSGGPGVYAGENGDYGVAGLMSYMFYNIKHRKTNRFFFS
jgi:hypothetical protein